MGWDISMAKQEKWQRLRRRRLDVCLQLLHWVESWSWSWRLIKTIMCWMLRRSGKGASEEDCSEHALSQSMSAPRAQGLDLLLSRDHDNDYTCNLLWIWTRIYKQSVSTFEVNFHIWKDWVCNDCARRGVICTHCSHKQSSLPLSCSPSGEEFTSGTSIYSYQLQGGVLVFVCFTTFALGMVMFISYSSFMWRELASTTEPFRSSCKNFF